MTNTPRTLYEKIWDAHVVSRRDDGTCLLYIDRHLVHEVTSPQAFEAMRLAGRTVRRPDLTLAVPDHNIPTTARHDAMGNALPIEDIESAQQVAAFERNGGSVTGLPVTGSRPLTICCFGRIWYSNDVLMLA